MNIARSSIGEFARKEQGTEQTKVEDISIDRRINFLGKKEIASEIMGLGLLECENAMSG